MNGMLCAVALVLPLAGMAGDGLADAAFARRPAEIVRAGRTADDHRPVVSFGDVAKWRVETSNAVVKAEYATDRVLFDEGACKITYRKTGGEKSQWAKFYFPQPIDMPPDADTMSIWIWGNNLMGRPENTPSVAVIAVFEKKDGKRFTYELGHVLSPRWSKYYLRFSRWLKSELAPPAKMIGLMVHNIRNTEDRFIYLDSLCIYREELKTLSFPPRAKRGVQLFTDAPQGLNTGEGRLPFPNTPRTVLPPAKTPDPSIEYRIPENPADWDSLAFRGNGGEWIPLAKGGGIFPESVRDAEIKFFRDGDSLVCDVIRRQPGVEEVRFGAVAAPDAVATPVPFWNYREKGWMNRPSIVSVKSGGRTLFVSATPDWTQSNASVLFAGRSSPGLAAANGGVRYNPKTDGKRNGCFERFIWTVSHDFDSTLPSIPNPPAKWKSVTGTHLWHAQSFSKLSDCRNFWWGVKRRGMKKIVASEYGMFWSDNRDAALKWGEGESFQPLYAAVDKGGDDGFREHLRYVEGELGFRYAIYNDYVDLKPTCRYWSPDNVVRKEDGTLLKSWPGSYSSKPVWAVGVCEKLSPQLKEKFGFDCGYCDVQTCATPWSRTDYDSRVPGAGTFAQTYYAYGEILLLQRKAWNGPLYSEGNMHWMYAGLSDGNYGQDEEYDLPRNPWLVNFDLMRIHPLSCDFGMGHNLNMFYMNRKYDEIPADQRTDRFLSATAAFGHPGYLIVNWINSARSYFLIQSLAARYTMARAKSICYADSNGVLHPTSVAVANGAYLRSQVAVTYDDGTVVVANGSTNEYMSVEVAGRRIVLPPNAFWGKGGDGKAESFLGEIDGHRAEWAHGDGYKYVNGRGIFTRFPDGTGADCIVVRLDEGNGVEEVIPTATTSKAPKPPRIELPYVASSVIPLDYRGNAMSRRYDFEVKDGRTLLPAASPYVVYSWRVTRNVGNNLP